ncbi:MAG: aldehyde dehydrogenase family protein [Ilumatobacteraceae bacterium]
MSLFEKSWPDGLPIGASWLPASEQDVIFPYDGQSVAAAPVGTVKHALAAVDAAVSARRTMGQLPSHVRRAWLRGIHAAVEARRDQFEHLLVLETGKPLRDCKVEVSRALVTLDTGADEVARLHGETVPLDLLPSGEGMIGFWQRKPIGVVIGITGFNYPLLLATHKVAPAIASGCPIVLKTAPSTPLSTLWLVHLIRQCAEQVGAPTEGVQLVTGDVSVGEALTTDPRIGIVSFTGSSVVGHAIAKAAAPRKVVLELGSNSALIVDGDADIDAAAKATVRGGYYASGQACISIQRILVVDSIRDAYLNRLTQLMKDVVVGDPRNLETQVSALINGEATSRVSMWIDDAVAAGARVLHGGTSFGSCIQPTVLIDIPEGAKVWDEEVFGPVVCVRTVANLDEAIKQVNTSRFGLQASIFTSSIQNAFRAIEELEVGGVVVNEVPGYRSDTMPYGGVKDSGIGREGPRFAIEEFTVTRMAIIRPVAGD